MKLDFLDRLEQRGEQRGLQLGMVKGQRELVRELLEDRFGPLSPEMLMQLEAWPSDRLLELGRALMSAQSIEELGLGEGETG